MNDRSIKEHFTSTASQMTYSLKNEQKRKVENLFLYPAKEAAAKHRGSIPS